jgi:hypothetical protein
MAFSQTTASCPRPPEGYRPVVPFEYPKMRLQVASLVALVAAPSLLLPLISLLRHQAVVQFVRFDRVADTGTVLLTALATMMAHELLHGAAHRAFGYRVSYGVSVHPVAAYVAAFGQWHTRNRSIVTALVPTVVLTAVCAPLLTLSSPSGVLMGLTALTMNASAVAGDLYLAWCLFRMPRGTLLYPVDMETLRVYVPVAQGEEVDSGSLVSMSRSGQRVDD